MSQQYIDVKYVIIIVIDKQIYKEIKRAYDIKTIFQQQMAIKMSKMRKKNFYAVIVIRVIIVNQGYGDIKRHVI